MNASELMERINKAKAKQDEDKLNKEMQVAKDCERLKNEILDLMPRIVDMQNVANKLYEAGIGIIKNTPFSNNVFSYGRKCLEYAYCDFTADACYHLSGFYFNRKKHKFEGMAKIAGGACGNRSLYVNKIDGVTIWIDDNRENQDDVRTEEDEKWMKMFIEEFDEFESEFYEFVKSVTEIN